MINRAALIWMVLAITSGTGLFLLKYEVRAMEDQLVQIKQQTLKNLEAVHVLKAEWSYLNHPTRLEDLAGGSSLSSPSSPSSLPVSRISPCVRM